MQTDAPQITASRFPARRETLLAACGRMSDYTDARREEGRSASAILNDLTAWSQVMERQHSAEPAGAGVTADRALAGGAGRAMRGCVVPGVWVPSRRT